MTEKVNPEDIKKFLDEILKDIPKEHQEEHLEDMKNLFGDIDEFEKRRNIYPFLKKEQKEVKKNHKKTLQIFKDIIKLQAELSRYLLVSHQMRINLKDWDRFPLIYASYLKNITTYIAILELIKKNLYGPARMLIRNLFESLLLSKYCFITENQRLFEKWDNGEYINITNEIINKIEDNNEIRELKNILNNFTHFSVYSNQDSWKYNSFEIELTLMLLYLMLQMNFTMYHRYLVNNNSLKNMIIRSLGNKEVFFYHYVYENTKDNLKQLKKTLINTNKSKKLFKELEKKWKIKYLN